MKYRRILIASLSLLMACAAPKEDDIQPTPSSEIHVDGDVLRMYQDALQNAKEKTTYTITVKDQYDMRYSDQTMDRYTLDGVLEVNDDIAHVTQHIDANGMHSEMDGYYYDNRLYNTYNNITYYEDMSFDDVKKMMLVPMAAYPFQEAQIQSITYDENTYQYEIHLNENVVKDIFLSRYDSYGMDQYPEFIITDHKIIDTFDKDGTFLSEQTQFTLLVRVKDTDVEIDYTSNASYVRFDETTISLTDEMKETFSQYVAFMDIDTSAIEVDTTMNDAMEDTVTDTFRKRIVSRLNYKNDGDDRYTVEYNDGQSYMIDFTNHVFEYSNRSIHYVYNWKGDIATMSKCTYDFQTDQASSDCKDTTIETIKQVKSYLEMELYYCGLSLEDLQKES